MEQLTVTLVDLPRADGSRKHVDIDAPAPANLGAELIGVPEGTSMHVVADLVAVEGGVYVTGTVEATVEGQCSRCLREIREDVVREISDLAYYPAHREKLIAQGDDDAEDHAVISGEELDLEPIIRDAVVLGLPFRPLCRPDCAGLCPVCGERLDDLPADHHHDVTPLQSDILDQLEAQLREDTDE